jgi:hypothetical protein
MLWRRYYWNESLSSVNTDAENSGACEWALSLLNASVGSRILQVHFQKYSRVA